MRYMVGLFSKTRELYDALGNETRLSILILLRAKKEMSLEDFRNYLEKENKENLKYHLNILEKSRLIQKQDSYYSLTEEGVRRLSELGITELEAVGLIEKEEFSTESAPITTEEGIRQSPDLGVTDLEAVKLARETRPLSSLRIQYTAAKYGSLALKFAPKLYYIDSEKSFENIKPEDIGGLYWRPVESSVDWADVCIQYIVYFKYQHWVPSIFDKFSGKLSGKHPNDFAPIFLYLKNEKPVRVVFDICHYEAVGVINIPSPLLPQDKGPQFHIKNFYRGLLPLEDTKGFIPLKVIPHLLGQELLNLWWNGFTSDGTFDEKAKLIIREKLENPFKEITTFRDRPGELGFLFHLLFQSKKDGRIIELGEEMGFEEGDIKETGEFIDRNILVEPEVLSCIPV